VTKTLTDWTTEREIRAVRSRPEVEALRAAYLELLKLTLCDLGGAGTISVGRTEDGQVYSRELGGEQLLLRTNGMDWPLNGLTMVGLLRLDDLQVCVESAVADGVDGDLIEAGAWRGGAAILMRAALDSLGADERTVWVADSFTGFPVPDLGGSANDPDRDEHLRGHPGIARIPLPGAVHRRLPDRRRLPRARRVPPGRRRLSS